MKTVTSLDVVESNLQPLVENAIDKSGGLLRLAPCWVPRSFLMPGGRLKLDPRDLYILGGHRGGILRFESAVLGIDCCWRWHPDLVRAQLAGFSRAVGPHLFFRRAFNLLCRLRPLSFADCVAAGDSGDAAVQTALDQRGIWLGAGTQCHACHRQLSALEWLPPVCSTAQERNRIEARMGERRVGIEILL